MLLIQTDRDNLLRPLQAVGGIVERRHTLPILSNVLIENDGNGLAFSATDLEIQISTKTSFEGTANPFSITLAAKKLQDICRSLLENTKITIEQQDGRIQLKAGRSKFNLQTLPATDFPKLSEFSASEAKISLSQRELKRLLNLVYYAMAQQDIRYYLNGLLLVVENTTLTLVATDGHRLGLTETTLPNACPRQEVILPRKTVLELSKLLTDTEEPVTIEIGSNQVRFIFDATILITKIVDGKFPDFQRVIPPSCSKNLAIPRLMLLHALQRVAILSNEKFKGVRLVLTENSLSIISTNNEQEEAQEELEIEYQGEPLDIGFNVTYLLDVLNNLSNEIITWGFNDANSSALVTVPELNGFKYVVMPMRI